MAIGVEPEELEWDPEAEGSESPATRRQAVEWIRKAGEGPADGIGSWGWGPRGVLRSRGKTEEHPGPQGSHLRRARSL